MAPFALLTRLACMERPVLAARANLETAQRNRNRRWYVHTHRWHEGMVELEFAAISRAARHRSAVCGRTDPAQSRFHHAGSTEPLAFGPRTAPENRGEWSRGSGVGQPRHLRDARRAASRGEAVAERSVRACRSPFLRGG